MAKRRRRHRAFDVVVICEKAGATWTAGYRAFRTVGAAEEWIAGESVRLAHFRCSFIRDYPAGSQFSGVGAL